MTVTAFQPNAFQNNAFQVGGSLYPIEIDPSTWVAKLIRKTGRVGQLDDVLVPLHKQIVGFEAYSPELRRSSSHQRVVDIALPPISSISPISPWGFETASLHRKTKTAPIVGSLDVWWVGLAESQRLPSKGGGDYYRVGERFDGDVELAAALSELIADIDSELSGLSAKRNDEIESRRLVLPDKIYSPGWRAGREEHERSPLPEKQARYVHYNFASDIDFGFRRKIVSFLQTAERIGLDLEGSDAFVASRDLVVGGRTIRQGMNVWQLQVEPNTRVGIAKFNVARGFRLVSYDATSLHFVHAKTFPWRPLLVGAGAGLLAGHLLWNLKKM